ncbi:MAG: hypothetical protein D6820_04550 [Lentisphaerae bacterium]|nr:MAG: hypothetical protein D6820_04550 [Lentisphaerota bacterium]
MAVQETVSGGDLGKDTHAPSMPHKGRDQSHYYWPAAQWFFIAFIECAIVACFWEVAHPWLTLALLFCVPVLGFCSWWFDRSIPLDFRKWLIYFFGGISIIWLFFRFNASIPKELWLAEGLTLSGLGFLFSPKLIHQRYLLTVGVVLLVTGAFMPPRIEYVVLLPVCTLIFFFLLFYTRNYGIAGRFQLRTPIHWRLRTFLLGYLALILLCLPLAVFLFQFLPTADPLSQVGLFMGNRKKNMIELPDSMSNWLMGQLNTTSFLQRRPTSRKVPGDRSFTPADRKSTIGRDLVMRVQSTIPTYWLARLYDVYTGSGWKSTPEMENQTISFDFHAYQKLARCNFEVTIEKWFSPYLYSAFPKGGSHVLLNTYIKREYLFYTERLPEGAYYPSPPFSYRAKAYIPKTKDAPILSWYEKLPKQHYLQLPPNLPKSVRRLATRMVGMIKDPYLQAILLRNYLRTNFKYALGVPPPPEGTDMVKYFLMTTQKGHCEYFASAMTVLARCVGIPARMATGFAPGDYNPLKHEFEVYEYHAHAWAQVFIEGKGWLTMDATPDSAIQFRPAKKGVMEMLGGALDNPFSNEWRVSCPELAPERERLVKLQEEVRQEFINRNKWLLSIIEKTLYPAKPKLPVEKRLSSNRKYRGQASGNRHSQKKQKASARSIYPGWRDYDPDEDEYADQESLPWHKRILLNLRQSFRAAWRSTRQLAKSFSPLTLVNGILLCIILIVLIELIPIFMAIYNEHKMLSNAQRILDEVAQSLEDGDPNHLVVQCYRAIRDLLIVARLPRLPGESLSRYAAAMHHIDIELGRSLIYLFNLYDISVYSPRDVTRAELKQGFQYTIAARDFLLERIRRGAAPVVEESGQLRSQ